MSLLPDVVWEQEGLNASIEELTSTWIMGRWVTTSTFRPGSHQSKVGPLPAAPTLNLLQEGQQRPTALQILPWHPLFRWGELLQSLGQEGRWNCLPWASCMGWWTWTCSPMKGAFREHHRGINFKANNVLALQSGEVHGPPVISKPAQEQKLLNYLSTYLFIKK